MSRTTFMATCLAALIALPVAAAGIMVMDPYARSASKAAKSGAAFMMIHNTSGQDDRLLAARSDAAARVELHTHIDKGDGVMQMTEIDGGIVVPAGGKHMMVRGGDHVMFMGLNQTLAHGESVEVTLQFEKAGDITVTIPVDLERKPKHGHGGHDHSGHDHSNHGTDG